MLLRQAKKNMYERGKARFLLNLALNSWDSVKQNIFWKGMFYADNVFQCWHIKKRLRGNEIPILVAQHTHIFALNFKGWIWLSKKNYFLVLPTNNNSSFCVVCLGKSSTEYYKSLSIGNDYDCCYATSYLQERVKVVVFLELLLW